jgi:hypothetical protein
MFQAIDTADKHSITEESIVNDGDQCVLYVEGAFLKPAAIVEKLKTLASLTRRSIVGLIPPHATPTDRRYWAKVAISNVDRTKRVQTDLAQLASSALCVAEYVQTLRPQAIIAYSQGANVVLKAQMEALDRFPPVIAICPGVIAGLDYQPTARVSLMGATHDQFIDNKLRLVLANMLGVPEHVLQDHTHDWSETMAKAAADMLRGISTH